MVQVPETPKSMPTDELDILGTIYVRTPTPKGDNFIWTPKFEEGENAGRDFPSESVYLDAFVYAKSGLAWHEIDREDDMLRVLSVDSEDADPLSGRGFAADQLQIFHEFDWYLECSRVLQAHGWMNKDGSINRRIHKQAMRNFSADAAESIKKKRPRHYQFFLLQRLAIEKAEPLGRLWYAVNMLSLYYCQRDMLRLGFLWAEYQSRIRHEGDAARGRKSLDSAREGGARRSMLLSRASAETLQAMAQYVNDAHSVSNAARLAFKAGYGASMSANRKLWHRHVKK